MKSHDVVLFTEDTEQPSLDKKTWFGLRRRKDNVKEELKEEPVNNGWFAYTPVATGVCLI